MEAHASLEPLLRHDVREALHGDPDPSLAAEEQPGDHEGQAVGRGLGDRCVNQVGTAGLWGVGEREGKWGCWAEWTVGACLDVRKDWFWAEFFGVHWVKRQDCMYR
jgi:hypothetical protein